MECKKIVPSEFKKITSYSPLLLGVGCMKVENRKFEQYLRGQFLSMVNIITRHKTPYMSKNIAKQLVASLFCVFTGFQQVFTN